MHVQKKRHSCLDSDLGTWPTLDSILEATLGHGHISGSDPTEAETTSTITRFTTQ